MIESEHVNIPLVGRMAARGETHGPVRMEGEGPFRAGPQKENLGIVDAILNEKIIPVRMFSLATLQLYE